MAEPGTFEKILGEIGQAFLPLRQAFSSPDEFVGLLQKLGWHADAIPQPLRDLGADVETLYDSLRRLLGDGGLNVGGVVGERRVSRWVVLPGRREPGGQRGPGGGQRHPGDQHRAELGVPGHPGGRRLPRPVPRAAGRLPGHHLPSALPPVDRVRAALARRDQGRLHRARRQPAGLHALRAGPGRPAPLAERPLGRAAQRVRLGRRGLRLRRAGVPGGQPADDRRRRRTHRERAAGHSTGHPGPGRPGNTAA